MSYGGRGSLRVAHENVKRRAKLAANDPTKSRQDNPEHRDRPDLRRLWDKTYLTEAARLTLKHGV